MKRKNTKTPQLSKGIQKIENFYYGFLAFSTMLFLETDYCLAADTLFDKLNTSLGTLYKAFAGIATGLFALYALINLIGFWQNERDAEVCRRNIKRGAKAYGVILCLGAIITYASTLFDGMGYNPK